MNASQFQEARAIAQARLERGADPSSLVHVLYYPNGQYPDEIQGLSTPLGQGDYFTGNHTAVYYTLAELAEWQE
jgi:hypothetical protein